MPCKWFRPIRSFLFYFILFIIDNFWWKPTDLLESFPPNANQKHVRPSRWMEQSTGSNLTRCEAHPLSRNCHGPDCINHSLDLLTQALLENRGFYLHSENRSQIKIHFSRMSRKILRIFEHYRQVHCSPENQNGVLEDARKRLMCFQKTLDGKDVEQNE